MKLLEGIQLHELVLIILGFTLGLVLIFVFLMGAMRGNTNMKLLYGFIAPLIMIGYPSIRSIEFSKDVIKIDKLVEKVKTNPKDTLAARELIDGISTLPKSRCVTSSDAMTTIANAQAAVGLYDSAKVTIQKAMVISPKSDKVLESSREIEEKWENHRHFQDKVEHLKTNIKLLNAKPKDKRLRDSVAMNLEDIKRIDVPIHASQGDILAVGMAAAIVGESEAAEQVADDVLRVSPNQAAAKQLKEDVRDGKIERKYQQKERDRPKPQSAPRPAPNGRIGTENVQKPPVVESPAAIKMDTAWQSKLIPKATLSSFVKWDKEQ
jgi:hypothetical protein